MSRSQRNLRGNTHVRLRVGLVLIAMLLSLFGARLFQLQGIDSRAYATRAAEAGLVTIELPAERGRILDRNGVPLAESVAGLMIVADPTRTAPNAEAIAKILADELGLDYFDALAKLTKTGTQFVYLARRVPSTLATKVMTEIRTRDLVGVDTRTDPLRVYPAGDVAANMVGFVGEGEDPAGGLELAFDKVLAGKDGSETYEVGGGNRIPLGDNSRVKPVNGKDLTLTIDRDVQWYTQRLLRTAVQGAGAKNGSAVVLDSRTGEVLSLADYPTYDPNFPEKAAKDNLRSRALTDVYEPGSVEKVLTAAGLIDAGKVTPATRIKVPSELPGARPHDRGLVRPRRHQADDGRGDRALVQHRHRAGRQPVLLRGAARLPRQVRAGTPHRRRPARRDPRPAAAGLGLVDVEPGPDLLRTGRLGECPADGGGGQHGRQPG